MYWMPAQVLQSLGMYPIVDWPHGQIWYNHMSWHSEDYYYGMDMHILKQSTEALSSRESQYY